MDLRPDDRVLVLTALSAEELSDIAAVAALVVCVLESDAVYDVRAALREFQNVMVIPADPTGSIPWRDEFFSVVYSDSDATGDTLRVLIPGGRLVRRASACGGLQSA